MMRTPVLLLLLALPASACERQPAQTNAAEPVAGVPTKGVDRSRKGQPAPDTLFADPDGGEARLADFEGVPVLVNLWATWCAPCVKELPTLDSLARRHAADGSIAVIAVSQDAGPRNSVRAFLEKLKVRDLGAYHDPDMGLSAALGAEVLPTTILFDAEGRELWRYVGDLDWTGEEAARLLSEARPSGPS